MAGGEPDRALVACGPPASRPSSVQPAATSTEPTSSSVGKRHPTPFTGASNGHRRARVNGADRVGDQGRGRRLYDKTNVWGGRHPLDLTTVVVTDQRPDDRPQDDENFVFVTAGIMLAGGDWLRAPGPGVATLFTE